MCKPNLHCKLENLKLLRIKSATVQEIKLLRRFAIIRKVSYFQIKKSSNNFRFYYIKFFTSFIGTGLLIPRSPFTKVIKQISEELTGKASIRFSTKVKYLNVSAFSNYVTSYLRFTSEALEALQVASEAMITQLFEDSVLVMVNAKRLTLMVRDLQLVRRIRGTL